jgi:hypothetical protein
MPYGYYSDSESSRSEYEPTEEELFRDMEGNFSYSYYDGVSVDDIKIAYDNKIHHFSDYFLSSALEGLTPDEYFTQRLLPYLEEQLLYFEEQKMRAEFAHFKGLVFDLIFRSEIIKAREFYDAEISHHYLSFLDGLTPDAYFSRFVEEVAKMRAHCARARETQERQSAFYRFHLTVIDLIETSKVVEAREFYDAEISHHDSSFLEGLTPEAYFARLVEDVGLD